MSIEANLQEMEQTREHYWRSYPQTSPIKLRWRALTVRHCFHILPGETVLEIGAGTGLWTEHLADALRSENEIAAAVFNREFAEHPRWNSLRNVRCRLVQSLDELPAESFDYIVGTAILCHNEYRRNLHILHRLLKPGGQLMFFENNFWNPQVFVKTVVPPVGRWWGNASCQVGLRRPEMLKAASSAGFSQVDITPYDIVHPLLPRRLVALVQSWAFLFEHTPLVKELCGTLSIRARRPCGTASARAVDLCEHEQFDGAVSFVIPCYNESANVRLLAETITAFYGAYIHEILFVNDNSTDDTAAVIRQVCASDPRVKLIDRPPPNGVGLALKDGVYAATGRYIFTMDADFVHILPEFRDLFDAVAGGYDGAVGSRFTLESVMINYPFMKILGNRGFHFFANRLLRCRVHDVSNNLKLFRAEIFQQMSIEEPHFAANAEIGFKAVAGGYRICEVPVSWINRTADMGRSSFRVAGLTPSYFTALLHLAKWARRREAAPALSGADSPPQPGSPAKGVRSL